MRSYDDKIKTVKYTVSTLHRSGTQISTEIIL